MDQETIELAEVSTDKHFKHSVLRERIIEHVFTGEILKRLWQRDITDVEVLRSEFDAGGYDLVMSYKDIVRHIQLKVAVVKGKRTEITANLKLAEKPSGCILIIEVSHDLDITGYHWFGSPPHEPFPQIQTLKIAKHPKANSTGVKSERAGHRVIPRKSFIPLQSMDEVIAHLFGEI